MARSSGDQRDDRASFIAKRTAAAEKFDADLRRAIEARRRAERELAAQAQELKKTNAALRKEISRREKAQRELAIFRQFAESSQQAMGMANLEGTITYANRALCRVLGRKGPRGTMGTNVRDYYSEQDLPVLEDALHEVIEKGEATVEIPLVSRRGKRTLTIQNIFVIRDEDQRPTHFANAITDISKRKNPPAD